MPLSSRKQEHFAGGVSFSEVGVVRPARRSPDLIIPNPKLKLMEQVHEVMRFKQLSLRTEETYWNWIRQFLVFCRDHPHLTPALSQGAREKKPPGNGGCGGPLTSILSPEGERKGNDWRHPREVGKREIEAFLSHLTTGRNVAVSTQNQALNLVEG